MFLKALNNRKINYLLPRVSFATLDQLCLEILIKRVIRNIFSSFTVKKMISNKIIK